MLLSGPISTPFRLRFGIRCGAPCAEARNAEIDNLYSTFGGSAASKRSLFGDDFAARIVLISRTSPRTRPGLILDPLNRSWAALGRNLGDSWVTLGPLLCALDTSWAALGPPWDPLGSPWSLLGSSWAAPGRPLDFHRALLATRDGPGR